jgi:hypothetical protein
VHVVIGGLHGCGAPRDASTRKFTNLHFGLGVDRDAKRFRVAGCLSVDAAQMLENGIRLRNFF